MKKHTDGLLRNFRLGSEGIIVRAVFTFVVFDHAFAQSPEELFSKGNESYRSGQFQAAVKEYESIINQGYSSSELYFNIGNAYFRLNKIAPAVLAYERAARIRPGDPDIVHNLKLANLKIIDRIDPVPELFIFQWMRIFGSLLSHESATTGFIMSWALMFISLSILSILKQVSFLSMTRWVVAVSLACVVAFGGFMGIHSWEASAGQNQAIIMAPVVTAKSSPDDQGVDAFVIHEGLKVQTSDAIADWKKIILPDGKVGWIRSDQCKTISMD
ncbi:MAG: tetratricopeptide repeat protein [Ignavibacteriales bacterium]|nr:tetratricopeptide repeat protein [Ignavibacteriales bacterium]